MKLIFIPVNLTIEQNISINSIDKIAKVCYTKIKLENKIKILTNNKNKHDKKGKQKMEFIPYNDEIKYNSAEQAKAIQIKLGHAALFNMRDKL